MKLLLRALWTVLMMVVVWLCAVGADSHAAPPLLGPATGYMPHCRDGDEICSAWAQFRTAHPFPYQTVAARRAKNGDIALVVSEPPPVLDRAALDQLTSKIFGPGVSKRRMRWPIGADGWLEDLVVVIPAPTGALGKPAITPRFRDQLGLLVTSLYGTTYGTDIDTIEERHAGAAKLKVNSLSVTPQELSTWISDKNLKWRSIKDQADTVSWSEIEAGKRSGSFISSDGRLVILTFSAEKLTAHDTGKADVADLRVPFRQFAVASECVFGGIWTQGGQVAIVARFRTTPTSTAPPLRFETFQVLADAARNSDELQQSYERTQIFAGKLLSGNYTFRDWAPIYLSPQLVDTELGALLDTTDQMLKSWSSAGQIEYLYFDYTKPSTFPFGKEPLSSIVERKTGEHSVLFNWNTAGSTFVVKHANASTMNLAQTGSLPVTYGAGGRTAREGGKELYEYEDSAYRYFSSLRDPNLQQVVQYTLMYQLFRATVKDRQVPAQPKAKAVATVAASPTAGQKLLAGATKVLLQKWSSGEIQAVSDDQDTQALQQFVSDNASLGPDKIAAILSDRMSPEAHKYLAALEKKLRDQQNALVERQKILEQRVDSYNALVDRVNAHAVFSDPAELSARKKTLEQEQAALEADFEQFSKSAHIDQLFNASQALSRLAQRKVDLDSIRQSYQKVYAQRVPKGSIKTPSVVLSWSSENAFAQIGGHNVDARALKFEPTPGVTGVRIAENADGSVTVRYDAASAGLVEGRAGDIARAVEHRGLRGNDFEAAIPKSLAPVRARDEALMFVKDDPNTTARAFARLGGRAYTEGASFIGDLRAMAESNRCCTFITHDANQIAYMTEVSPKPPPVIIVSSYGDTPSLMRRVIDVSERPGDSAGSTLVFLDEPQDYVRSVATSVQKGDQALDKMLAKDPSLGLSSGGGGSGNRFVEVMDRDFDGKRGSLQAMFDTLKTANESVLAKMGVKLPAKTWKDAIIVEMDNENMNQILQSIHWSSVKDGRVVGVSVKFADAQAQNVAIIATTKTGKASAAGATLKRASSAALDQAAKDGANTFRYLTAVKNRVNALQDKQIDRLTFVVKDKETAMHFTQLGLPNVVVANDDVDLPS
ncbi:hypothetical protein [Burkholderia ubonensis]|uniref:hypothetical protein n=1 Tax=Burkholderia ubonensis TaxID=101571 RepID=UPI000AC9D728|nr:hypothetical protein [Burkholderia ubonensis]